MPMLFPCREPDHIAGTDFFDRSAHALYPSHTGGHDQGLPQGMGMPGGPGARFESHTCAAGPVRAVRGKQHIHADVAAEPVIGSLHGRLGAASSDFHSVDSFHWGRFICWRVKTWSWDACCLWQEKQRSRLSARLTDLSALNAWYSHSPLRKLAG